MVVLHALQHVRVIAVGLFSLTAFSLLTFQSVEVVHAFMSMFSDTFHKN
ncbi:hypothetical protein [Salibacterium halotolerans]|uniref:Uncharacterized protein n=1 Tax=Salibacterium halotolerans TaxID=1884432 RepID=A0A1I5RNN0_9BACI|nr:hypothetical protein [Salibacterium halotolerans]SFP60093.1 hypothetical protein SAMN05518683_107113 [Salibacterium halotolerans]